MLLVTINNKILNFELLTQHFASKSAKFQITVKMIPLQGPVHHPELQYFNLKF